MKYVILTTLLQRCSSLKIIKADTMEKNKRRWWQKRTWREFHLVCWTRQPIERSFSTTDVRCLGMTGLMDIADRVIAAAIKKVPASIRSGIILYSVPWSFLVPVMLKVLVPAPFINAPHEIKKFARSTTSGSCMPDIWNLRHDVSNFDTVKSTSEGPKYSQVRRTWHTYEKIKSLILIKTPPETFSVSNYSMERLWIRPLRNELLLQLWMTCSMFSSFPCEQSRTEGWTSKHLSHSHFINFMSYTPIFKFKTSLVKTYMISIAALISAPTLNRRIKKYHHVDLWYLKSNRQLQLSNFLNDQHNKCLACLHLKRNLGTDFILVKRIIL